MTAGHEETRTMKVRLIAVVLLALPAYAQNTVPWPTPVRMDEPHRDNAARWNDPYWKGPMVPLERGGGTMREDPLWVHENPNEPLPAWMIAIPTAESAAVVIGRVATGLSRVSADGTAVYADYVFQVDKVLKSRPGHQIKVRDILNLQREGGYIVWPSGQLEFRGTSRGVPKSGVRYVMFLEWDEATQTYPILTGYDLRDGQVVALDTVFAYAVRGKLSRAFVSELETAIRAGH